MPNNRIDTITCPQNSFINQQECPILVLWSLADWKNHMIKKHAENLDLPFCLITIMAIATFSPDENIGAWILSFCLYCIFQFNFFLLVNSWSIHIDCNYEIACIQSFQTFQSLQALISLISIFTFFACVVWCISTDLLLWSFTQKNH